MSTKLPTISVNTELYSESESESSSDDDSSSNDMDYNRNSGVATDVEDFDSQADGEKPRSRRSSSISALPKKLPIDNDVTDVEDYNDSDSEDEEKSKVYPELKMSLQEFLQHDLQEQAIVNNEMNEKIEVRAGDFLQAQNLNGLADYLTDCEDYDTESELEYDCEKSVCVDIDPDVDRVCITDASRVVKTNEDSDEYEDVSVLSDISDLVSALADVTGVTAVHGMSEDELLEMSADEEVCQIVYSGASSDIEDDDLYEGVSNASLPAIDVTFVEANGLHRKNSTSVMSINKSFLDVSAINEEVLTDVERMDDSAAEEDSFDNDEDSYKPIPRAVILAPGDDGVCMTDTEDMISEAGSSTSMFEAQTVVAAQMLPPPHREIVILKEDKYGDTITNVMPMDSEFQFGIYSHFNDHGLTDTDEYSCDEECERRHSIAVDSLTATNMIEGDITVSNEVYKPQVNKRAELHSNAESVTDVEDIVVAGTNRRKKLKTRSMSKGKSKFLDIARGKEDGGTDVEDMDLSDSGLPSNIKRVEKPQPKVNDEKVTDVEDITSDEVSDVSDSYAPHVDADNSSLKEYTENSLNLVVCVESDGSKKCRTHAKSKIQNLKLNHLIDDDGNNQPTTDIEDVQLPSDVEEACDIVHDYKSTDGHLNDMLNESYTVVHERSGSSFNMDAEKLHIKGMPESRDAHTDVEYVESDESAARGGGN